MINYISTKQTRIKANVNGITLIPLLNSVLTIKRGYVWITETATTELLTQRKHKVISTN
jgi:hypothetical protein